MQLLSKILTLLMLLTLSACASGPQVKERYFWPAPPDEPKIEWLGTYYSQLDLKEEKSVFAAIIGEEEANAIINPATAAADGEGRVYVSDLAKRAVLVFNFNTREVHQFGGAGAADLFKNPSGIAFDAEGNIYTADLDSRRIYVFDKNERPIRTLDLSEKAKSVGFIAIDKERKRIIVPDVRGHKVFIVGYDGKIINTIDQFRDKKDGFSFPTGVALDLKGNIIVADSMNSRILRFTPEGEYLSTIGQRGDSIGDIATIKGVAVDSEGHIYMTDVKSNRIQIYNEKGETLLAIGKYSNDPKVVGGFHAPTGIFIDKNDSIYVVEKLARRFQIFQYLNSSYLARHPITKDTAVAAPLKEDDEKVKGKQPATPKK